MQIEVCNNAEWICQLCGPDDFEGHGFTMKEAACEYADAAILSLESAGFTSDEIVGPKGQRSFFHGWNGAHFTHRCGGIGTFADLTPEQVAAIEAANEAGCKAVAELIDEDME